jgi:hypothetical protein
MTGIVAGTSRRAPAAATPCTAWVSSVRWCTTSGTADGSWIGVLGVLKAIVWPVFVVYELLGHLAS